MSDTLRIEYTPLSQVRRWIRNPKKHDLGALADAIERYGFVDPPKFDPLLNDGEGGLVYGNGRDEALEWMKAQGRSAPRGIQVRDDGEWLIPVKYGVDAPTLAEAEALAIDHNNLTMAGGDFTAVDMLGMWEPGEYTSILSDLAAESVFPLTVQGDDLDTLLGLAAVEPGDGGDDFDTTPEDGPTRTALDDLWIIRSPDGREHRLLVGDCTDPANVERLMGGERAALCFTSPPYADQREYSNNSDLSPLHLAQFITVSADTCDLYAVNLGIARKDNEVQTYWDVYIESARAAGLKLLSWNVWDQGAVGSVGKITAMFPIEHEFVFIFGERRIDLNLTVPNKTAGTVNNHVADRQSSGRVLPKRDVLIRDRRPVGTVARCAPQKARNVDTSHPAMFPVELPVMYFEACTDGNDAIYDPFFGSGTTLIAAHRTGRRCYGMEISCRYADVILRRAEAEGLTCERVEP